MVERVAVQSEVESALARVERVRSVLGQVHSFAKRERQTALWDATHRSLGDLESVAEFLRTRRHSRTSAGPV